MKARTIETKRGARCRVLEGGSGVPVVFFHGVGGLFADNPFLDQLARTYHVFAPELPGYGDSTGEDLLEDMLDFTLHGWDVVAALGLERPHLVGHSMGGMITAEMACLAPLEVGKLALVSAAGLWMDEHPIPDLFALLPFEFADLLFHDPARGAALLTGGVDFSDMEALKEFYIGNSRRMAMAGKLLFPVPNRRVSKRLYRLSAPTLVVWGNSDKLIPPVYAERWAALIPHAAIVRIEGAGHMLPYEQPEAFVSALTRFLAD
ncbi:MAG TPA: alpha/beta fold hydrolase [Methylomirabilota bacterium]|jgi:pimeloyl-ACP methyl ester carboxylesterase|nr:alpha/beta fold hydrolase [Methylomirabilota bacterium]